MSSVNIRDALDRMGWRIIVVTRHDYFSAPEEVLRRVRDALIERGMLGVRVVSGPNGHATLSGPERLDTCDAERPLRAQIGM